MNIQHTVPLASFTTFHIGGPADYFLIASTLNELLEGITFAKKKQLPLFVLGTGANILVGDRGFRGLVIKNEAKAVEFQNDNDATFLTAESGATIAELIRLTADKSLSGLEHFVGIPSSLGGALWQNLHFLSPDRTTTVFIGNIVKSARIFTSEGRIQEVDNEYFRFAYDYSILHDNNAIVLSAGLKLQRKNKGDIMKTINANLRWRKEKHPEDAEKKSAGSIFKKIEGYGAGRLIDKAGLKGKRIGGAEISTKHANYIMNVNNATARDVRELINLTQKTVKDQLGLELQTEINFVGEF